MSAAYLCCACGSLGLAMLGWGLFLVEVVLRRRERRRRIAFASVLILQRDGYLFELARARTRHYGPPIGEA